MRTYSKNWTHFRSLTSIACGQVRRYQSRSAMAQFPEEQTTTGAFKRQEDAFRDWVKRAGSAACKPERGRYHLYVSSACPWAHRIIILRKLKGLEDAIGMTVVDPLSDERGWAFRDGPGHSQDPINGFKFLSEA